MYNAHYQRGRIHTNEHLLLFLPWGKEIYQISIVPKQALINAFYLCLQTDYADCDCKGTTKFAHLQEKSHFSAIFYSAGYRRAQDKWRVLGVGTRETGIRRAEDREHGTGKVLDGDTVVTEWYRNNNEVVSRKIAGKKHIEGRMKVRGR